MYYFLIKASLYREYTEIRFDPHGSVFKKETMSPVGTGTFMGSEKDNIFLDSTSNCIVPLVGHSHICNL